MLFFASLWIVLCVILGNLYCRAVVKEDQRARLRIGSPYARIISNSAGIQKEKYPLHHSLSDGSIEKIKFLEPQKLKDNTETLIIVLGDRPLDDTTPTVDMVYRVLKGVELANKFPKAIVIMSGGATKGPTSEAQMMGLIAWSSIRAIHTPLSPPAGFTLAILGFIIVLKEGLYRWVIYVGNQLDSAAVRADAWHHRLDAGRPARG